MINKTNKEWEEDFDKFWKNKYILQKFPEEVSEYSITGVSEKNPDVLLIDGGKSIKNFICVLIKSEKHKGREEILGEVEKLLHKDKGCWVGKEPGCGANQVLVKLKERLRRESNV